jgi:hypothetical protein
MQQFQTNLEGASIVPPLPGPPDHPLDPSELMAAQQGIVVEVGAGQNSIYLHQTFLDRPPELQAAMIVGEAMHLAVNGSPLGHGPGGQMTDSDLDTLLPSSVPAPVAPFPGATIPAGYAFHSTVNQLCSTTSGNNSQSNGGTP